MFIRDAAAAGPGDVSHIGGWLEKYLPATRLRLFRVGDHDNPASGHN
jgi:hypothetical protein